VATWREIGEEVLSRRARARGARAATAIIATAGLALLAAACASSPAGHLAVSQPLAFSHCMRSHGVPKFPDPNSGGVWPKSQVELASSDPRFQAGTRACAHLLPDGGPGVPPSPAVVQLIQTDMSEFARCMRSHGVPNWPDPTLDRGRAIFDPQRVGIDANAPQISTKVHECEHVFPASIGIPPGA
jgi:hypothetical protein